MIRRAEIGDASSLAAVGLEVWLHTYIRDGVSAFFADYALAHFTAARFEEILSRENEHIWVAQGAAGIVGFAHVLEGATAPVAGCSDVEISTLYVQPRHQNNGAGWRLLDAALAHCASTGKPDVWLTVNAENQRAIDFYLRNGFKKAGETLFRIGNQAYPNHVLQFTFQG
ncbi:N-acetyltransferase [Brucella endophytica]|uniref:N-acetyltransferase n=1 Tax=Brucella endophytica TaxID=1963359 RepID=A0A916SFL3_9HYPH|nr:N-acetyltransferase [Brucella endophytica]GGA96773.1 N-acetyltransferase [Brucella endophytica]